MSTVVEPPPLPLEAADADVEALEVAELVAPPDDALLELLELDDPQPARSATTTGSARREARFM